MVRTVKSDKVGTFKLPALPHGDYLAIALEYVLDGDWNDPQFLESLRERATRVSLREARAERWRFRSRRARDFAGS